MSERNGHSRVLIAGSTVQELANLWPYAERLAQAESATIHALGLVQIPKEQSLSTGARAVQQLRSDLARLSSFRETPITFRVTHDFWEEIRAALRDEACNLLLVNYRPDIPPSFLQCVPCDVILVHGAFPRRLKRILLPIRGGPYARLALQVSLAFARALGAHITLLHVTPPARLRSEDMHQFYQHLRALPQITRWIKTAGKAANVILEHAHPNEHQLVVIGSTARRQPGRAAIGATASQVLKASEIPVLMVKSLLPREAASAPGIPPVDYTISVVVDKWFAENTFHAHEFQDIRRLVELKEKQGLTISLGLPTLNEEKTIGRVIRTVREKFVRRFPLLDEIVVIDSNSTDRTVEIATALGVPVVKHPEILTQYGTWQGKGEALWSSLYVLKGDLIAWIDTDIVNIHPRFVYGILGPLIREPRLMYVKGFYQRPLRFGRQVEARGGGRVTELVARPLLNLFYPELSGFVQPLAGEYAGRREALERVPFFTGYGVEIGLLIDLWSRYGLRALGQVDLEERVHRNQSLLALSKMAFEIIQVVMQRVGEAQHIQLIPELHKSLKLIRYELAEFRLEVEEIRARERPPMITIPEYRRLRGIPD